MIDPLEDGNSFLALIDSMGNSLSVVNDARQSFENRKEQWQEKDEKLLNYLARNHHTSPFRGVVFKWQVTAPLFVARQWWKHTVASTYVDDQLGWNEKSFRYCSAEEAKFYIPKLFAKQSDNNRQASDGPLPSSLQNIALQQYVQTLELCKQTYESLLLVGVSKEQARAILPAALYTSFVWTCSLQTLFHFIALRKGEGAQGEIIAYADGLLKLARPIAPEAFHAFETNNYQF